MNLWTSAEYSGDIDEALRLAQNDVERSVNLVVHENDYGPDVIEWAHIPMVFHPGSPNRWPERVKYHKKDRSIEFRLKIDHAAFKAADPLGQRKLIFASLMESTRRFPKDKVKDFNLGAWTKDLEQVGRSKGWL